MKQHIETRNKWKDPLSDVTVSLRMPETLRKALAQEAARAGVSDSCYLREALAARVRSDRERRFFKTTKRG